MQKLDYLPFGVERVNESTSDFETRFTFTDQERDAESDLMYYGARYYNARIGRFTSQDEVTVQFANDKFYRLTGVSEDEKERQEALQNFLSSPQQFNVYAYAGNNPLKYVDPSGNLKVDTSGASEDEKALFEDGLNQLIGQVRSNEEIQEYFEIFGVDIIDVLLNEESGPVVKMGGIGRFVAELKGVRGMYNSIFNKIYFSGEGLSSVDNVKNVLIHELAHWANDAGDFWGDLMPDISPLRTTAKSEKFNYLGEDISVITFITEEVGLGYVLKDSMYGFAAQVILFGEIK